MNILSFNNYIENLNSSQINDRNSINLFYEWYNIFDTLINEYIQQDIYFSKPHQKLEKLLEQQAN